MIARRSMMMRAGLLVMLGLAALAGYAVGQQAAATRAVGLPPAAAAAVSKAVPGAEIRRATLEREGVALYEVELVQSGTELEVEVSPDGTIAEIEKAVARADLPAAVAATLAQAAGDAEIKELQRTEIHAVVKLVRLERPAVVFEAEFVKDGKTVEVKIDENGMLLAREAGDADDDDDDDDKGDEKVSLDKVPAAVKAAILKEAGANPIKEIEVETEDGKTVYEAEWVADGKEVELKVSADGTILGKEVDDDDDDDDDD